MPSFILKLLRKWPKIDLKEGVVLAEHAVAIVFVTDIQEIGDHRVTSDIENEILRSLLDFSSVMVELAQPIYNRVVVERSLSLPLTPHDAGNGAAVQHHFNHGNTFSRRDPTVWSTMRDEHCRFPQAVDELQQLQCRQFFSEFVTRLKCDEKGIALIDVVLKSKL